MDEVADSKGALSPGTVVASHVRNKLNQQLRIDLNGVNEKLHIVDKSLEHEKLTDVAIANLFRDKLPKVEPLDVRTKEGMTVTVPKCNVILKKTGQYIARIYLNGGHTVPLKFEIVPR